MNKGLGDTIHNMTKAIGIPHCKSCQERREKLNKLIPYNNMIREFKEEEAKDWEKFLKRKDKNKITDKQKDLITRLLKDVLGMSVKMRKDAPIEAYLVWADKITQRYEKINNKVVD